MEYRATPVVPGPRGPFPPGTGWAQWAALACVGCIAALFAAVRLFDGDFWWLLASGHRILREGLPGRNLYSFAFPDFPWRHTQWLFSVALAACDSLGGLPGTEIFQVSAVAGAYVLTFDTARRKSGTLNLPVLLPILVLALSASRPRFVPRPHLASFLGLALLLNLWERKPGRMPLWFGIIGMVWANCHAGVVFGLAACVAIVLSAWLEEGREHLRPALFAGLAFLGGSLVNPYFLYPYLYSFRHLDIGSVVSLAEFRHPGLYENPAFFLLAALAAAAVPFQIRSGERLSPLLFLFFLPLSGYAIRIIPKFALVVLPGLCATAQGLWPSPARGKEARVPAFAAVILLLAASIAIARWEYRINSVFYEFGFGVNTKAVPEGAVRFIEARGLSGRMYNDFGQGGYLLWRLYPGRKVFLDGRLNAFPAGVFREIASSSDAKRWAGFVGRYGFDYAVVERGSPYGEGEAASLFEANGWLPVYIDGISLVYVKPGTGNAARAEDAMFRLVASGTPVETLAARAKEQPGAMRAEIRRIDPDRLLHPPDFYRFGSAAMEAGDAEASERIFRAAAVACPDHMIFRIFLGDLRSLAGRPEQAREEYRKALRIGGDPELVRYARERMESRGD